MDLRPIMPGPVAGDVGQGAPIRFAAPDSASILAAIADAGAQLSQPDIGRLIRMLEARALPERPSESRDLLRGAITAAQSGNASGALKQLSALIQLDPAQAAALRTEPGLEPVRAQVNQLVMRLETAAGSDAQAQLAQAARALESRNPQALPGWDTAPRTLFAAASRLNDAGGYVNFFCAAALARVIIEGARPPAESAAPLAAIVDSAAALQLSQSDADKLVRILEPPSPPQQPSASVGLLSAAVSAVRKGDLEGALRQLAELIRLAPNRANALLAEPGLDPIRGPVDQLLRRLESMAGLDAQTRLAMAAKAIESWGRQPLPGWDAAPQTLLTAATRLYDAGGYVNYLHAASIAQEVVEDAQAPITDRAALARLAESLQLSQPDTDQLIRILDPPVPPRQLSAFEGLLSAAVSAARKGDLEGALKQLAALIRLAPNRANALLAEPDLEPIRAQVGQLLIRLESMARTDTQARLADAAKALESWGQRPLPGWDAAPQTLLAAANRLYNAGGYVNYLHAASIAEAMVEGAQTSTANRAGFAALRRLAASLQFSPSDTDQLIRILEPSGPPRDPVVLQGLFRSAVSAVQRGDADGALKQLTELIRLDPNRAIALRAEPELEPVRAQVEQLLMRLESLARTDAQARLADAAKVLESWGRQPLPGWDAPPQTVLAAVSQLCDAGGHVNYLLAASLAQAAIEGARFPIPAKGTRPVDSPREPASTTAFSRRLKALWARAPLLVLLASWFALGLAATGVVAILHYLWPEQYPASMIESGFALWGIGFLALVAFGFYARVRRIRFR